MKLGYEANVGQAVAQALQGTAAESFWETMNNKDAPDDKAAESKAQKNWEKVAQSSRSPSNKWGALISEVT